MVSAAYRQLNVAVSYLDSAEVTHLYGLVYVSEYAPRGIAGRSRAKTARAIDTWRVSDGRRARRCSEARTLDLE